MSTAFAMPARFEGWLRVKDGSSPLGALISFQASPVLSGVQARVTFRNRPVGAERSLEEVAIELPLVPSGRRMARPVHTVRGTQHRSRIALRLLDREGRMLTGERDIGECVDGLREMDIPFTVDTSAVAWITALDWSERTGPRIRLSGELIFTKGLDARLTFRTLEAQTERSPEAGTQLQLIGPGTTLYSAEKTLEGGLPGFAWVSVLFVDSEGRAIGEENVVGRCVVI